MKEYIDKTEEYLSELVNYFNCIDNCVEKINIITKIDELVFWLQMYQDNYLWEENWTMEKFLIMILANIIGFSLFSIIKLFLEKIIFNDIRKTK